MRLRRTNPIFETFPPPKARPGVGPLRLRASAAIIPGVIVRRPGRMVGAFSSPLASPPLNSSSLMSDVSPESGSLITSENQLAELVEHIRERGRFAFDTEFVSEETFEPVLCLIQVATTDRLAVVDPLALRDISPFWDVVLDPKIEVVMHAAGEDLRICQMKTGGSRNVVFDVQIAAGLVGYSYPLSLVNLVYQTLRISLAGSETRTDWRRRPLTPPSSATPSTMSATSSRSQDLLKKHLSTMGRESWAAEEFADFLGSIESRAEEERWRRLPGLHQLNRRSLEMARRLSEWREDNARRTNRPLRQTVRTTCSWRSPNVSP